MDNASREGGPVISPLRAWWAVFVLFLAYMLSYIDRTIIALVVEPLRLDLDLTDTQISLLQGVAFAIFYSTVALPIAVLADRMSRRKIIATGVVFWSVMTSACGLAGNFWQLFVARMGVGIGEATLGPAAYSLISDLFSRDRRGRAMGLFTSGVTIGGGLAFIVGGAIVAFAATADLGDTIIGEIRGWQLVFLLLGPPGLVVALLLLTIPEPRTRSDPRSSGQTGSVWPLMAGHWRFYLPLFLAGAISGMMMTAVLYWAPTFLIRVHGMTAPEAGKSLGLGLLFAGPAGAVSGGWASDRWTRAGNAGAPAWILVAGIAMTGVSGLTSVSVEDPIAAVAWLSLAFFFGGFAYPGVAAAIQDATPVPLLARTSALFLLIVTLVSAAIGPTLIAVITDYVYADTEAIGRSLGATLTVSAPLGVALGFYSGWLLKHGTAIPRNNGFERQFDD